MNDFAPRHAPNVPKAAAPCSHGLSGFSLLELLLCVTLVSILAAVAAPLVDGAMRTYALSTSAQTVASQIRQARMLAVSRNQTMRVRFNCPAVNSYRIVEFVGNAAIDTAANRCSEAVYPYPDQNPAARPDADRPVIRLPENATFTTVMDLEIANTGRVTRLTGCPNCVTAAGNASLTLSNGSRTQVVQVTPNGQVQIQ
jgi:prepilin-type N-terminal cleavage/methylation domain-containing protein